MQLYVFVNFTDLGDVVLVTLTGHIETLSIICTTSIVICDQREFEVVHFSITSAFTLAHTHTHTHTHQHTHTNTHTHTHTHTHTPTHTHQHTHTHTHTCYSTKVSKNQLMGPCSYSCGCNFVVVGSVVSLSQ